MCSSLDPVLRLEQRGINPIAVAIIALALIYLTATPGKPLISETNIFALWGYPAQQLDFDSCKLYRTLSIDSHVEASLKNLVRFVWVGLFFWVSHRFSHQVAHTRVVDICNLNACERSKPSIGPQTSWIQIHNVQYKCRMIHDWKLMFYTHTIKTMC